jgi:hypothetical protein
MLAMKFCFKLNTFSVLSNQCISVLECRGSFCNIPYQMSKKGFLDAVWFLDFFFVCDVDEDFWSRSAPQQRTVDRTLPSLKKTLQKASIRTDCIRKLPFVILIFVLTKRRIVPIEDSARTRLVWLPKVVGCDFLCFRVMWNLYSEIDFTFLRKAPNAFQLVRSRPTKSSSGLPYSVMDTGSDNIATVKCCWIPIPAF